MRANLIDGMLGFSIGDDLDDEKHEYFDKYNYNHSNNNLLRHPKEVSYMDNNVNPNIKSNSQQNKNSYNVKKRIIKNMNSYNSIMNSKFSFNGHDKQEPFLHHNADFEKNKIKKEQVTTQDDLDEEEDKRTLRKYQDLLKKRKRNQLKRLNKRVKNQEIENDSHNINELNKILSHRNSNTFDFGKKIKLNHPKKFPNNLDKDSSKVNLSPHISTVSGSTGDEKDQVLEEYNNKNKKISWFPTDGQSNGKNSKIEIDDELSRDDSDNTEFDQSKKNTYKNNEKDEERERYEEISKKNNYQTGLISPQNDNDEYSRAPIQNYKNKIEINNNDKFNQRDPIGNLDKNKIISLNERSVIAQKVNESTLKALKNINLGKNDKITTVNNFYLIDQSTALSNVKSPSIFHTDSKNSSVNFNIKKENSPEKIGSDKEINLEGNKTEIKKQLGDYKEFSS